MNDSSMLQDVLVFLGFWQCLELFLIFGESIFSVLFCILFIINVVVFLVFLFSCAEWIITGKWGGFWGENDQNNKHKEQ